MLLCWSGASWSVAKRLIVQLISMAHIIFVSNRSFVTNKGKTTATAVLASVKSEFVSSKYIDGKWLGKQNKRRVVIYIDSRIVSSLRQHEAQVQVDLATAKVHLAVFC